jgi:hypothetical protein
MRDQPSSSRKVALLAAAAVVGGFLLTLDPGEAEARPRPRRGEGFEANKTFGLGLMIGFPTGLSGKYFVSSDGAFDFGVGLIGGRNRDGLHLHFDYLWHPVTLVKTEPFYLPLYFGLGARLFDWEDDDNDDDFNVGLRVPVGVAFDFNNVPLDIFLELVFVLDFETDRGDTDADFNGAAGIRYWFQ